MRIPVLPGLLVSAVLAFPARAQMPDLPPGPAPREEAADARRAEAQAVAWNAYGLRVARALGKSDGARDLALAALLAATAGTPEGDPAGDRPGAAADTRARPDRPTVDGSAEATRWRADAAARGASDVITQQLLLAAANAAGDQAAAAEAARRWQALTPGNFAPLVHQGLDTVELLAAAARSSHNAPDPYPALRWIAAALTRHPPTASEWAAFGEGPRPSPAANAAVWTGTLQGLLLPDHRALVAACTGRQLGAPGRADGCRHVADLLLARPQTVLDERIGLSLARAVTQSAAERAPLDARRRGVDWRQEQIAGLAARTGEDGAAAAAERQARLLADPAIATEDAMVRQLLSAAGLAQEPPPGWRAPWERAPR